VDGSVVIVNEWMPSTRPQLNNDQERQSLRCKVIRQLEMVMQRNESPKAHAVRGLKGGYSPPGLTPLKG
jgi:hypothetical protein